MINEACKNCIGYWCNRCIEALEQLNLKLKDG